MTVRIIAVLSLVIMSVAASGEDRKFVPKNGFVPDEATAIAIAEAVAIPVYGRTVLEQERPYRAKLQKGIWIVSGQLKPGTVGGVVVVEIAKGDGKIISMLHGK